MITEQERRRRRLTYRLVQLALIGLSVGIVVAFFTVRRSAPRRGPDVTFRTDAPSVTELGAGDARLFNIDTTVELVLRGDKMLAGLSPKTVAKVRAEIDKSTSNTPDGIGGIIAQTVKEQVADKIDIHAEYDVRDIEAMWLEDYHIVVQWKSGKKEALFGSVKTDGKGNRFDVAEAERFIELVNERRKQLNR